MHCDVLCRCYPRLTDRSAGRCILGQPIKYLLNQALTHRHNMPVVYQQIEGACEVT